MKISLGKSRLVVYAKLALKYWCMNKVKQFLPKHYIVLVLDYVCMRVMMEIYIHWLIEKSLVLAPDHVIYVYSDSDSDSEFIHQITKIFCQFILLNLETKQVQLRIQ